MVFYSIWDQWGRGFYTYVLPEQHGREQYFPDDVSWWIIPGTVDVTQ